MASVPYYQHPEICSDDLDLPPHLILTVDFSRAALTATLFYEEDCIFELLRELHRVDLASDALDKCEQEQRAINPGADTIDDCLGSLTRALGKIAELPIRREHSWPAEEDFFLTRIDGLVLLGERGTDLRLRSILKEVLANQSDGIISHAAVGDEMVDPSFAAARGVAAVTWGQQDEAHCDPGKEEL